MGLDTMILGNIDGLLKLVTDIKDDEFYLLDSPFHQGEWINGIQMWNGDWSWLYNEFNYEKESSTHRGEENYLIETLIERKVNIKSIQKEFSSIQNYKTEYLKRGRKKSSIIYFHGKPRPWNTPLWRFAR